MPFSDMKENFVSVVVSIVGITAAGVFALQVFTLTETFALVKETSGNAAKLSINSQKLTDINTKLDEIDDRTKSIEKNVASVEIPGADPNSIVEAPGSSPLGNFAEFFELESPVDDYSAVVLAAEGIETDGDFSDLDVTPQGAAVLVVPNETALGRAIEKILQDNSVSQRLSPDERNALSRLRDRLELLAD